MFSRVVQIFFHAISPIHAGSGSEIGIVDLPIQREKHTGYPKIDSSSLKGAIRAAVQETLDGKAEQAENIKKIEKVFGGSPTEGENDIQAGAIAFADARQLLFPVRSLRGVFAWITCPLVLNRYNQELSLYQPGAVPLAVPKENTVSANRITVQVNKNESQVLLEEYAYPVEVDDKCVALADQLHKLIFLGINNHFTERLVVLSDDDFADFVNLSTEINARIRINPETGTVQKGALWYEENVPPETVFYSFCFAGKSREVNDFLDEDVVMSFIKDKNIFPEVFQLGGNSTLGRGILRHIWI
ncbi:MAG: type III-B CRISPR module RAMP protein Cmr4 [Clostridia bacterium]|nr:type III-B CRISPR module RAMP protein Cmr4 [Clostridia bacterium]